MISFLIAFSLTFSSINLNENNSKLIKIKKFKSLEFLFISQFFFVIVDRVKRFYIYTYFKIINN